MNLWHVHWTNADKRSWVTYRPLKHHEVARKVRQLMRKKRVRINTVSITIKPA